MTKKAILEAVRKAQANGEDLQLWQAVEWIYSYGMMTYKEYTTFMREQVSNRKAVEAAVNAD